MKKLFPLIATAAVFPHAVAAQAIGYYCDSGAVVVQNTKITLEEYAIIVGMDKAERPDFGHYIFRQPDGTYIWARTSDMRRICRKHPECRPGTASPSGLVIGPSLRISDSGEVELCEEPQEPRDITITTCAPDGTLSTNTIRSDDGDVIETFGIGVPPSDTHHIYQHSDGALYWSVLTQGEAAVMCVPEEEPNDDIIPNDGNWVMALRESSASDCPPQAVAQGEAIGQSMMQNPQITWSAPHHPSDMIPDDAFDNQWGGSGTSWSVRAVEQDTQMIQVTVDYTFEILDPDHVQVDGHLQFLMAASMAQVAGFGGNCQYHATFDVRRTAP